MQPSIYPSKVDLWLAAVLILAPITAVGMGVYLALTGEAEGWISVFTGCFMAVVMAAFTLPCHYTLDDRGLHIRCGLMEDHILLQDIRQVTPTFNPLAAPALSIRRVRIDTAHRSFLISPRNRERFIEELEQRQSSLPKLTSE
ncbi:MAG: PH domain-containing protein [Puniceicoccaceae bacterium]